MPRTQTDRPTLIPSRSTRSARRRSSMRIPAALVPTPPTEAELAACEAQLADAVLRDRDTVRARGRR